MPFSAVPEPEAGGGGTDVPDMWTRRKAAGDNVEKSSAERRVTDKLCQISGGKKERKKETNE